MSLWTAWDRESGNPNAYLRALVVLGFAIYLVFNVTFLFVQTRAALKHIRDGPPPPPPPDPADDPEKNDVKEEFSEEETSETGSTTTLNTTTTMTPTVGGPEEEENKTTMGLLMWVQVVLFAPTLTSRTLRFLFLSYAASFIVVLEVKQ